MRYPSLYAYNNPDISYSGTPALTDGAKKIAVDSLTLRRNFSLLYDHLEPSLLVPLLSKTPSYEDKKKYVESYQKQRHAHSAAMIEAVLSMRLQMRVPDICIALRGREDQQKIGQQLLRGKCLVHVTVGLLTDPPLASSNKRCTNR